MNRKAATLSLICIALLAACQSTVKASGIPALTMTSVTTDNVADVSSHDYSLGYTFTTTRPLTISALGAFDWNGNSVAATVGMPVKLYYSNVDPSIAGTVDGGQTSGTLVPGFSTTVVGTDPILGLDGGTYTSGDGFRYHDLASPLTLPAGTYELVVSPLHTNFGFNATNFATVGGIADFNNPLNSNPVYNLSSISAGYAPNPYPLNTVGDIGPNFLIATPEPASIVLGSVGLLGLLIVRRRKNGT